MPDEDITGTVLDQWLPCLRIERIPKQVPALKRLLKKLEPPAAVKRRPGRPPKAPKDRNAQAQMTTSAGDLVRACTHKGAEVGCWWLSRNPLLTLSIADF